MASAIHVVSLAVLPISNLVIVMNDERGGARRRTTAHRGRKPGYDEAQFTP
jgi:hypothetical protein